MQTTVGVLVLGAGLAVTCCGNGDSTYHSGGKGGLASSVGGALGGGGKVGAGGLTTGSDGLTDNSAGLTGAGGLDASGSTGGNITGGTGNTGGGNDSGGDVSGATGGGNVTGGMSGNNAGSDTIGGAGGDNIGGTGGDNIGGTGGDNIGGTGGDNVGGTGGDNVGGSGGVSNTIGPCDIYADDGVPCVAAYSMVRRLSSTYAGPLYQVRSDSYSENLGVGGTTHDIGMTPDGFADGTAQDAACGDTICTVSVLYDQSGHGNDLPVATRTPPENGGGFPDHTFESMADTAPLTVGGHEVYSLHTEAGEGYSTPRNTAGDAVPVNDEPQGIYMLADGTQVGTECCWDFGGATADPGRYTIHVALNFGTAYWGQGAGDGPWFGADFEAGVWMGGTVEDDPGWGDLFTTAPPNLDNPSLAVPFALGFLKTDETNWALRMADLQTAANVTTAYEGGLPKPIANEGAIVLGLGSDNSHNSWGTFFEGAIVAGWPSDDAEHAIMQNIQAVGYGQ